MDEKILALGDVHGSWNVYNNLIKEEEPDLILQVGDFGFWPRRFPFNKKRIRQRKTKTIFAPGNHEDWWTLNELTKDQKKPELVKVLKKQEIYYAPKGSTYTLPDGRVVLFMGGADSIDKGKRTLGETWFPDEIITQKDIYDLDENMKVDIVVSHTCPTAFSEVSDAFIDHMGMDPCRHALTSILKMYRPKLWFFGHFHLFREGYDEGCHWFCLNREIFNGWYINLSEV